MRPSHEMILAGTQESGAEEWLCPNCGRRVLLRWPPNYERRVLEPGDEFATHAGGKGGAMVGQAVLKPSDTTEPRTDERDWLRENGIDWGETA
jgi:hypothetical protein